MKRLLVVILLTVCSSMSLLAQDDTLTSAHWQTFAPSDEEFSIEVPRRLPSTRAGKSVTVAKVVEYRFTIY